jgi:hypothetical protein
MLFVSPARRISLATGLAIFFTNIFWLLSCTGVHSRVYRFTGNGDWRDLNNWQDKSYPGHILSEGDSLIIESRATCRIPPTVILIKGVLVVKGSLVNRADLTIAGQMLNRQGARLINGGSLKNDGLIVCERGAGLTLEVQGKLINSKGDTIKNNAVLALVHGVLQNDGVFINQEHGSMGMSGDSYTAGEFRNYGALQVDSALQIKGSFQNSGRLWCTNRAILTVASGAGLRIQYPKGRLQMLNNTQLVIQSSGAFTNDDSVWTDKNASIVNQGLLTNHNYLFVEGKLTNTGQLEQSIGLRDNSKPGFTPPPVRLFFGDTLLNMGSFNNSGGEVANTGAGNFVSFFQSTLKGFSGGNIYAITKQPSDAHCGSPQCRVSFVVAATGTHIAYQWQVSTDRGSSWSNVPIAAHYNGSSTTTLELTNPPDSFSGYQYRCVLNGPQDGNQRVSDIATLTVSGILKK